MNTENLVEKRIDILNSLSIDEKHNIFSKMNIMDLKKIIELIEEGEKND